MLFADVLDDAWQLDVGRGKLDLKEKREIYQGNAALGVRATFFQLDFHTDELLDPRGYRFLRLAFHPGEDTPSTPFFTVSINNKHLEKVWLLGEQARVGRVDLQRKEWQVVKIPLDFLLNEPIRRIRLEGRLQGTFFFDDLRLVSKGPSPLAAFWEHALPDSVASGTDLHVEATVHLNQFDSVGGSPSLTADLSALGGPGAMPLKTVGTRTYRLDISFIVTTTSGIRPVTINVEQRTAQRLFELHLEHPLVVVPAADRIIFADALASDWNLLASDRTGLDLAGTDQVYSGNAALTLRADTFRMDYRPAEPVDPFGYRFLRFAFHPGEAIARASFFAVIVNGKTGRSVDLLKENSSVSGVDMERKAWQLVEIPLELLTGDPIENIRIEGVLQGTFYLDDMRLVAAKAPSVTAILAEERGRVPPTFVLEQNVPNPFNHATVIRFALPDDAAVNLVVFNLIGQRVATLIDGPHRAGAYALRWDSRGDGGRELASGIYFYCLRTGQQSQVRSLLLLK